MNTENKYQRGKIYKIVDNMTDKIYIGSTCEPTLAKRLAKHVSAYKQFLNGKNNYVSSFKILENENYQILLLESFPCNCRDELTAREAYYIRSMECVNMVIPDSTNTIEYWKKRRAQKIICECGSITDKAHKSRHEQSYKHIIYLESLTTDNDNSSN